MEDSRCYAELVGLRGDAREPDRGAGNLDEFHVGMMRSNTAQRSAPALWRSRSSSSAPLHSRARSQNGVAPPGVRLKNDLLCSDLEASLPRACQRLSRRGFGSEGRGRIQNPQPPMQAASSSNLESRAKGNHSSLIA